MAHRHINTPLALATDPGITAPILTDFLADLAGDDPVCRDLATIIERFAMASLPIAARLAQGRLSGDPTAIVGRNLSGDKQQALDLAAHAHLLDALSSLPIATLVSEEAEQAIPLNPLGAYDLVMDPIDGSGSIGIGAPLGALFAIFPHGPSPLRRGRDIIAAGYLSFGHSVDLGFSMGNGVSIATLDPASGVFHVDSPRVTLGERTSTIAFNASNQRHWAAGLQRYVADLLAGADGPRGRDFNMRWIAAAVGDLHRILRRGGVFLYPADARAGYEQGFLRLLYEAGPIAYLIEQAGGAATDGQRPILDLVPEHLHARVPLFFGARSEIDLIATYLSDPTEQEP